VVFYVSAYNNFPKKETVRKLRKLYYSFWLAEISIIINPDNGLG
jgi:hypothetical protein